MNTHINFLDRLRGRLTGQPARVYANRRLARADLRALEEQRARAAARLNEDIEILDRYVNPLERYRDGDRILTPLGTILDRRSGKNLPLVWTELDLREFRRWARIVCDVNPFAVGFLGLLTDFHIRQGFGWQAVPFFVRRPASVETSTEAGAWVPSRRTGDDGRGTNPGGTARCQQVLDEWRATHQWGLRSREAFRRWRRDGEVFLRFFRGGDDTWGLPAVRFVEPEQVGPPPGEDADGDWSFGVLTAAEDVETVKAYFVRDPLGSGDEGDEVPAARVLHLKANVDSSIKRGLPDFLPVQEDLERVRRLLRNMGEVAAVQSAIAWVSQYATATVEQVGTLIRAGSDYIRPKLSDPSGRLMDVVSYEPGTVLHMDANRQFVPGPVGTGTPGFIQVEQAILRGCGVRWRFPEYFSGDASNNNLASSVVAGSPFVVAVEGNQLEWSEFERAVARTVLALSVESGRLSEADVALVDVKVTPPAVALEKREEDERIRQMRHQAGVLSITTWQQQVGLDPAHEAANFKAEAKRGIRGKDDADGTSRGAARAATDPPTPAEEGRRKDLPSKIIINRKGKRERVHYDPNKTQDGGPSHSAAAADGSKGHSSGHQKGRAGGGSDAGAGGPPGEGGGPSPAGHAAVQFPGLDHWEKNMSAHERQEHLERFLLPSEWKAQAKATRDNARDADRDRGRAEALSKRTNQELYGLIWHYAQGGTGRQLHGWAASANEVLLARLFGPAGLHLDQRKGWDAVSPPAVINCKLLTKTGNAQDNWSPSSRIVIEREMMKKGYQGGPDGGKAYGRLTTVLRPGDSKRNGVHAYPGYGQQRYKDNAGSSGVDGPVKLASEKELRDWVTGANPSLPRRVSKSFQQVDWGKVRTAMEMSRDATDKKATKILTNEKPALVAKAMAEHQPEVTAKAMAEHQPEVTARALVGHQPGVVAKELAAANPDLLLAETARLLGVSVEQLTKMKPGPPKS